MKPSGIETVDVRFVAQCLNQVRHQQRAPNVTACQHFFQISPFHVIRKKILIFFLFSLSLASAIYKHAGRTYKGPLLIVHGIYTWFRRTGNIRHVGEIFVGKHQGTRPCGISKSRYIPKVDFGLVMRGLHERCIRKS
jgi:hypothetical protein